MNNIGDKITHRWTTYPKYEYIIENIKEHQQISIVISDVLIIALFSGVLINVFSDSLITIIKKQYSVLDISLLLFSFIILVVVYYYFQKKLVHYRPANPTYSIHFSFESLLLAEIIEELNKKTFYKEEFETWYSTFEEKMIELFTTNPFLSKYDYKQKEVDQIDEHRTISLMSENILKTIIEIQTRPFESSEQNGKIKFYYYIDFVLTFSVLEPWSPEARSFIDNIYVGTNIIMSRLVNIIVDTFSNR